MAIRSGLALMLSGASSALAAYALGRRVVLCLVSVDRIRNAHGLSLSAIGPFGTHMMFGDRPSQCGSHSRWDPATLRRTVCGENSSMRWTSAVASLAAAAVFALLFIAPPCSADDLSDIVGACGQPSHDDSTLHDNPRPPMVTRFVDYDAAHLRIAFLLNNSPVGATPRRPYRWRLIGFLNLDHPHPIEEGRDMKINASDADRRLRKLCRPGFRPPMSIVR
jgi:hypothetical protein